LGAEQRAGAEVELNVLGKLVAGIGLTRAEGEIVSARRKIQNEALWWHTKGPRRDLWYFVEDVVEVDTDIQA